MYIEESKEEIVKNYGALLASLARKEYYITEKYNPKVSVEDFISEAYVAAMEAKRTFDPKRNKKFVAYLASVVIGKLKKYKYANKYDVSITNYKVHKEVQKRIKGEKPDKNLTTIRLDWPTGSISEGGEKEIVSDVIPSGELSPLEKAEKKEELECLLSELDNLEEREKSVLIGRFFEKRTLEDLATEMGLQKQTIHAIEKRAKRKLNKKLSKKFE